MYNASSGFSNFLNSYTPSVSIPTSYDNLASNVYGGTNYYTAPSIPSYGTYDNFGFSGTDIANMQYINNAAQNAAIDNYNASQFINTTIPDYSAWDGSLNNDLDYALAQVDQPFWEYDSPEGGLFSNTEGGEEAYWSNLAEQVRAESNADIDGQSLAEAVIDNDGSMQITETEVLDLSREAILGKPEKYGDMSAEELSSSIMSDIDSGNFSSTDFEQYLNDAGKSLDSVDGFDYQGMTTAANGNVGTLAQKLKAANDGGYGVKLVDDRYYDMAQSDPMMMTYGQYDELVNNDPFNAVNGKFLVEPMNTTGMSYGDFLLSDDPTNPIQGTRLNSFQRGISPQSTQWTELDKYNPYDLTGFSRGDVRESYTDFLRGMPVFDNDGYGLNPTVRKATNFLGNILDPIDDLVTGTGKLLGGGIEKAGEAISSIPLIGRPLGTSLRGLGSGIRGTAYGLGDFIDQGPQNLISSPVQAIQGLGQLAMGDRERGLNNLGRAGVDIIQVGKDFFSVPVGMAKTVVDTIRPLLPEDIRISISAGAGGGGGGGRGKPAKKTTTKRQTKSGKMVGREKYNTYDSKGNPVLGGRTGSRGSTGTGVSGSGVSGKYDLSTKDGQRAYANAYGKDAFNPNSPNYLPTILEGLGIPNLLSGGNTSSGFSFMDYVGDDIDYRNVGRGEPSEAETTSEQIASLSDDIASLKKFANTSTPAAYRV